MKWMMWAANVQTKSLNERLTAARAGGFRSMSAFPLDIQGWLDDGSTYRQILQTCGTAGVAIDVIDPFAHWIPGWEPPETLSASDRDFTGFDEDTVFEMAEQLHARAINLVEPYGHDVDVDLGVEHFGRICDRASDVGLRVQLEFMPFSGVADLAAAWSIVHGADRTNGGLTFDYWHYFRSGPDPLLLSQIPADKFHTVQISDARTDPGSDLMADVYRRLPPGDGDLAINDLTTTLAAMGALTEVGLEVFGPALTSLPATEIGHRMSHSLSATLTST